jgi:hypothetical protein
VYRASIACANSEDTTVATNAKPTTIRGSVGPAQTSRKRAQGR